MTTTTPTGISREFAFTPGDVWDAHLMQDGVPLHECGPLPKFPDYVHRTAYDSYSLVDDDWDEFTDVSLLLPL